MNCLCLNQGFAEGHYVLPPLPWVPDALEPFLDAETVLLHHDRHHAAYVAGANAATDVLRRVGLGELSPDAAPAAQQNLAFNLGGHILHCLYWENLSPHPVPAPTGRLADAINTAFGSMEGLLRVFRSVTMAVQGSGWGMLGVDPVSGRLMVTGICRHQDVLVPALRPLLVCDVWEHAYYLRYRNNRAGYVEAFLKAVDWCVVEERYQRCCCHE